MKNGFLDSVSRVYVTYPGLFENVGVMDGVMINGILNLEYTESSGFLSIS